jgi:hypothetical protein
MDPTVLPTSLGHQAGMLFLIAIPIACVAWTVTHEEVFREPREYCVNKSRNAPTLLRRKFFYLFTCEYCFSHYVTFVFLVVTRYRLIYEGWRGYLLAFFALVYVANAYMSGFGELRLEIRQDRQRIARAEELAARQAAASPPAHLVQKQ